MITITTDTTIITTTATTSTTAVTATTTTTTTAITTSTRTTGFFFIRNVTKIVFCPDSKYITHIFKIVSILLHRFH